MAGDLVATHVDFHTGVVTGQGALNVERAAKRDLSAQTVDLACRYNVLTEIASKDGFA
jgi:hypothetical protein